MGEPFWFGDKFNVAETCLESEDAFNEVHDLTKTPLDGSCDVFVRDEFPGIGCGNVLLLEPSSFTHCLSLFTTISFP